MDIKVRIGDKACEYSHKDFLDLYKAGKFPSRSEYYEDKTDTWKLVSDYQEDGPSKAVGQTSVVQGKRYLWLSAIQAVTAILSIICDISLSNIIPWIVGAVWAIVNIPGLILSIFVCIPMVMAIEANAFDLESFRNSNAKYLVIVVPTILSIFSNIIFSTIRKWKSFGESHAKRARILLIFTCILFLSPVGIFILAGIGHAMQSRELPEVPPNPYSLKNYGDYAQASGHSTEMRISSKHKSYYTDQAFFLVLEIRNLSDSVIHDLQQPSFESLEKNIYFRYPDGSGHNYKYREDVSQKQRTESHKRDLEPGDSDIFAIPVRLTGDPAKKGECEISWTYNDAGKIAVSKLHIRFKQGRTSR